MKLFLRILACLLLISVAGAQAPQKQKRVALVIGNADYNLNGKIEMSESAEIAAERAGMLPDLQNSRFDARDIRDVLTALKFDQVKYLEDADANAMIVGLSDFGKIVREAGPDAIVFVYFSGHGLQLEGENFLAPVSAKLPALDYTQLNGPAAQALMERTAISMDFIRNQLTPRSGRGVNIIVLDACRNNPWDPSTRSAGGRGRGLADMRWRLGNTLLAYSTEPGNTAYDGEEGARNSPYTAALKEELAHGDVDIALLFRRVANRVADVTRAFRDGPQTPWTNVATLPEDTCLGECARRITASADQIDPRAADAYFWSECCDKAGATRADYQAYLTRVSAGDLRGSYKELAEIRMEKLPVTGAPQTTANGLIRNSDNRATFAALAGVNDPLAPFQWYLRTRGTGPGQSRGGAGFDSAWGSLTQADRARRVIIAELGTGLAKDAPDLGGSLVAGVDLVSDIDRAADGDGADADPTDPGDACGGGDSSWDGTNKVELIAASANNRIGMAGAVMNAVKVEPVRVIGKCGGELSDINAGVRWASGAGEAILANGKTLKNATPAEIILMGLSIQVPCPISLQGAIDEAVARGAVIVVAAGNKKMPLAKFAPANCRNVIVAAASDAKGELAFYSNFGDGPVVLAPGGDKFNDWDGDGRPDGILTYGPTKGSCFDPETAKSSADCSYSYVHGTSSSAALVAAALGLMALHSDLKGPALSEAFLSRALSPLDARAQCPAKCEEPDATPVPDHPGQCYRAQCARGVLDMSRALRGT